MLPERWKDVLGRIKDNFEVEKIDNEHSEEEGGMDIESVIFKSPMGRIKLEFISKPIILDKKTIYSRRIGSETNVEYVYSQEEKSHKLKAYKWDDDQDDWEEIEAKNFAL